MFIHLGGETVVSLKDIVMILNFDLTNDSAATKEFLSSCQSNRQVVHISEETKAVVVTENKLYYSPISSITLKRRAMLISAFETGMEVEINRN